MNKQEVKRTYKKLLSGETLDKGLCFLKDTFQKKHLQSYSLNNMPLPWKKTYFKVYPRFTQVAISRYHKNNKRKIGLISLLRKRRSQRPSKSKSLDLYTLSQILHFSSGIDNISTKNLLNKHRRMYPSAGARYPLETYVVVLNSKDIPLGLYHYNVKWETLELLLKKDLRANVKEITGQKWTIKSGAIIIITAVFARTTIKYGERGWRYIFFEGGHLAQNIYLLSTLLNLKCCAIGGFLDEKVIKLLDINLKSEAPLYMISIGC